MTQKVTFYHAGCAVCRDAERQIAHALDPARFAVEIVHLGADRDRIAAAEAAGVASVPALVMGGTVLHINFGAALADVKGNA
jgi:hypothetical protein